MSYIQGKEVAAFFVNWNSNETHNGEIGEKITMKMWDYKRCI